jgi:hypothetical protein
VILWVTELLEEATGRPTGHGEAPDAIRNADDVYPYTVFHITDTTRWGGAYQAPDQELVLYVQVDAVGARSDQCIAIQDRVRDAIIGVGADGAFLHQPDLVLPTIVIAGRSHESGPTPAVGSGEAPDRVYTTTERFRLDIVNKETS